ncbi:hypothetical protein QOZ88_05940 [Blastococcus sp. BMG 814]|uniref:Phage Mu protein F like protein n=1 Tax=Blastococcus carthaginiensis TaxID=3050034 RepID=A0ABT9I9C2_9ACTN|nr:hypothetical protein [Blastococcus carthaginiensis]MDP5182171.1 hypothetical protein [Blastococcus carthaginiensis]
MPDLTDAYQRQAAALRERVERVIRATWGGLPGFRDADVDRWIAQVLPLLQAAQGQMASLTDAYLARLAGQAAAGLDLSAVTGEALRGVDPAEVYRRPAVTVRTELSRGKPFEAAAAAGLRRALSIATTDLQLAKTHAARANQRARGVRFFRRVLTGAEDCALCVIASTQRYRVGSLSPIHPGCDCGVEDLDVGTDPGQVIDPALLEQAHEAVTGAGYTADRSGRAPDYRKLIVTREHGELGPVIALAGHQFTGPGDL